MPSELRKPKTKEPKRDWYITKEAKALKESIIPVIEIINQLRKEPEQNTDEQ